MRGDLFSERIRLSQFIYPLVIHQISEKGAWLISKPKLNRTCRAIDASTVVQLQCFQCGDQPLSLAESSATGCGCGWHRHGACAGVFCFCTTGSSRQLVVILAGERTGTPTMTTTPPKCQSKGRVFVMGDVVALASRGNVFFATKMYT